MNRRQALQAFLNGALQAASGAVLASTALRAAQDEPSAPPEGDVKKRAEQVAAAGGQPGNGEESADYVNFRNGIFLNLPFVKGFLNGRFGNGFSNIPFRNGGFYNGGFRDGFRNYR